MSDENPQRTEAQDNTPDSTETDFPVVGIGASAGGLDAFEKFFTHMQPTSGMAFVLVQHLDPNHESMLAELIQRYTRMKVMQVTDSLRMKPNHVYIIPPNKDLALLHGELHLMEPEAPRGFRLPIDFFFRLMAEDLEDRAICIVLSGTGSDGSLGMKAIKEVGGLTIVQSPDSAKYDGMPTNAIATDMADFILSPQEMPEQLAAYVQHTTRRENDATVQSTPYDTDAVRKIFIVLRSRTGHDFSQYKKNTIIRRIERRMAVNQIDSYRNYLRYLRNNPVEVDTLFKDLLIGVTSFFRDEEAFAVLEHNVIPEIFRDRPTENDVRVWVCGCSTGEEAYSIAMLLREYALDNGHRHRLQVFATDIDQQSIEKARQALYPDNIAADVSRQHLERFFIAEGDKYRVNDDIRDMVIFATQNVAKDPPFSRINLISCRNLLIYLDAELQRKIIPLFHYALKAEGFLFLGTSETLGEHQQLFDVIDRRQKIYQKLDVTSTQPTFDFSPTPMKQQMRSGPGEMTGSARMNIGDVTERILLDDHVPIAILINERAEILYTHGRTGKYLEMVTGEPSSNLLNLAREGLKIPLTTAVRKVTANRTPVVHQRLHVATNGTTKPVRVTVRPVYKPASVQGLILVLIEELLVPDDADEASPIDELDKTHQQQVTELEQELNSTREYLQTTIEELETSNEELKSANEELQSSNEELQSTNEELETTKEELQSINEELMTVNAELENKIDELSRANNDLNNLLASIGVAIVFLDMELHIQRFNPSAAQLINLIDTDIGRPIAHIVPNFSYDRFTENAEHVLDTLEPIEEEVQTTDERWFTMRMRPYRTVKNIISGVIITFAEITRQKDAQNELRVLSNALEEAFTVVIITGPEGYIDYVNAHYARQLGYTEDEVIGQHFFFNRAQSNDNVDEIWDLASRDNIWRGELAFIGKDGEEKYFLSSIVPVRDQHNNIERYIAVHDDITEQKLVEYKLRRSERLYRRLAHHLPNTGILVFDHDLNYIVAEGAALERLGYERTAIEGKNFYDVVPPERQAMLEPFYRGTLAGKDQEITYTTLAGKDLLLHFVPLDEDDEPGLGGMVVIHEQKPEA
jgi:two-component system, chemotaxis family, CheB/CheR fusion protein